MNYQILAGRIANVPETKELANGIVTNFNLITTKYVAGEEKTESHRCVAWGRGLSTLFTKHVGKGDLIGFIGEPTTRRVERDGQVSYFHDVVLNQNTEVQILSRALANRRAPEGDA